MIAGLYPLIEKGNRVTLPSEQRLNIECQYGVVLDGGILAVLIYFFHW